MYEVFQSKNQKKKKSFADFKQYLEIGFSKKLNFY